MCPCLIKMIMLSSLKRSDEQAWKTNAWKHTEVFAFFLGQMYI